MFTWTARSPPKSETKIALFVNGKETGHHLWAAKSGKQSASQTAVSTNPIVKGFISHLSYNLNSKLILLINIILISFISLFSDSQLKCRRVS